MLDRTRRCRTRIGTMLATAGLAFSVAVPAAAAPRTGCAAEASGWREGTIDEVAAAVYPEILPGHPWPTLDDFVAAIAPLDANSDGSLCVKQIWGDELNPSSHWYRVGMDLLGRPVVANYIRENSGRNGSGR